MRRLILALLAVLALLPGLAEAQEFIRYYPPSGSSFTGGTVTNPIVLPDGYAGIAAAPYVNRQYDAIAVVSTTITAALAAIGDATYAKRYLLYVPDGTYTEEVTAKSYVDIVGQSRTGTILTSGAADSIAIGGKNMLLANMTITQTGTDYPIHVDGATLPADTPNSASTTIVYNVTTVGSGKNGIGIGLRANQRLLLIDSSFSSLGVYGGIYMHNTAAQSAPAEMTLLNVEGTGVYGLDLQNLGSTQPDLVMVSGGVLSGSTKDVRTTNSGAGAGEMYVSLGSGVVFSTVAFVDASKQISLPAAISSLPVAYQSRYRDFFQEINQSAGLNFSSTGTLNKSVFAHSPPTATPTSYASYNVSNSGAFIKFGVEAVGGGGLFSGTSGYSAVFGEVYGNPMFFYQGNTKRFEVAANGEVAFTSPIAIPMVADSVVQFGNTVMPDAGTASRFDVNTGTAALGVLGGVGPSVQGTSYPVNISGYAYVALAEDQIATLGEYLTQSATAGYCDAGAISTIGLNIGMTTTVAPVTNTIDPTGCGGGGCINTGTGAIQLAADVAAQGWAANDPVVYWNSGGTTPTGLTDGKVYFVKTVATTTVTISATKGGSAVVPSSQGDDATQYLQKLPYAVLHKF